MRKNAVFIAATGQNVGKTTLCLGILAALKKRYKQVGFIKPVGQRHVKVDGRLNVDKDAVLFKEHFRLGSSWQNMSPVIIPSGFTRSFLDAEITEESLLGQISHAFEKIHDEHEFTVVEGTGHVGVGSIVNLCNARIASLLGLEMVIIAPAGLGSSFDELALNMSLCQQYGVKVRGVILNRVLEDKREMISHYFPKTLKSWGVPLIGCVPYCELLSNPTMRDFEALFKTDLIAGFNHHSRSFQQIRLVASSLQAYEAEIAPNQLVITPASREDIIERTAVEHHRYLKEGKEFSGGLILTSSHPPSPKIKQIVSGVDIPVLYVPLCSYDAMKMITHFTAKIGLEDSEKINKAIELVEKNINFSSLCL